MNSNKPSNTLAIIGLVLGIIAAIFSFIPCVGTLAFIPGVVGLILGVISLMKARDAGHPQGLSISVIVVSIIACAISAYQIFAIGSMASDMKSEMKEYTTCEELKVDYDKTNAEMETLTKEIESDNASFSSISRMTKLGIKIGHLQKESQRMDCGFEFDNYQKSNESEAVEEAVGEGEEVGEGESESMQEEQKN